MANTGTIHVALKVDDKGSVRVIQNVGKESESTGKKGGKAFRDMDKSAESFSRKAGLSASSMLKLGAAVGSVVGLVKAWGNLKAAAQEYVALAGEQEASEAKLSAVLRATGESAGFNLDQLKAMAGGMQQVTRYGDEVTLSAMAILATFKQVRGEAFERATKAAMDMATVMGTDLNSNILQIGKALNDPIQGMTALSRAGVQFTEQQKEQITTLQESGNIMAAQNIVLKELETQFGGAAEAMAKDFNGALVQASNALGDTKEEMGFVITKNQFFIDLIHVAKEEFVRWGESINENREYLMELSKSGVLTVVKSILVAVETLRFFHNGWLGIKLVGQLAVQGLAQALDTLYPILRTLMAPLDALYAGMVKLGLLDVNPFDSIGAGLSTFRDSSAEVTRDVLADIESTNQKYDAVSSRVKGFIETIEKIPVAAAEASEVQTQGHDLRMEQIESQGNALKGLAEKELKALQASNQEKYKIDIELAKRVEDDVWLLKDQGYQKALKTHEETQTKMTQLEYDESQKRAKDAKKEYEDGLEKQRRAHDQFLERVQDTTEDKLYSLFRNPADIWGNTLGEMTDYFFKVMSQWAAKAIAEPIIVPVIQQIAGDLTSGLGFGQSSSGSGINPTSLLNWPTTAGTYQTLTSGTLGNLGQTVFGTAWTGGAVPISTGALAAGGELGWGASTLATMGSGSGMGGIAGGLAAAAPWAAMAAVAIPVITKLLEDEPDPRIGIFAGTHNADTTPTSDQYWYHAGFQDMDNRSELGKELITYFDARFSVLETATVSNINDLMMAAGDWGQSAWTDPEMYGGDTQKMFDAVEDAVMRHLSEFLVNDVVQPGLADAFDADFFEQIQMEGEGAFDTFARFSAVVRSTSDFVGQFTRQTEELGNSAAKAYQNIETITVVFEELDVAVSAVTSSSTLTAIDAAAAGWDSLIDLVREAAASEEQLADALGKKNLVMGAQITGLTVDSIAGALSSGQGVQDVLAGAVTDLLNQQIAQGIHAALTPTITEAGRVFEETGGDLEAVMQVWDGVDFAELEDKFTGFASTITESIDAIADAADTYADRLAAAENELAAAEANYADAKSAYLSKLHEELAILEDNLSDARENYISLLEQEYDALQDNYNSAKSTLEDVIENEERLIAARRSAADSIDDFINGLIGSDLAPVQSMEYYEQRYAQLLSEAQNADPENVEEAVSELTSFANDFLTFAGANGGDYSSLFDQVTRDLTNLGFDLTQIADEEEASLKDVKDLIGTSNDELVSIDDALEKYLEAFEALEQGQWMEDELDALNKTEGWTEDIYLAQAAYYDAKEALDSSWYGAEIAALEDVEKSIDDLKAELEQAAIDLEAAINNLAGIEGDGSGGDDGSSAGFAEDFVERLYGLIGRAGIGDEVHEIDQEGWDYWVQQAEALGETGFSDLSKMFADAVALRLDTVDDALSEYIKKIIGNKDIYSIFGITDPGSTDPGTVDPDPADPGPSVPDPADPDPTDPGPSDQGVSDFEAEYMVRQMYALIGRAGIGPAVSQIDQEGYDYWFAQAKALESADHYSDLETQFKSAVNAYLASAPEGDPLAEYVEAHKQFRYGGIIDGPESGYQLPGATFHGKEAIVPLRSGSIPVEIMDSGRTQDIKVIVRIGNRELHDITTEVIRTNPEAQHQIRRVANA